MHHPNVPILDHWNQEFGNAWAPRGETIPGQYKYRPQNGNSPGFEQRDV